MRMIAALALGLLLAGCATGPRQVTAQEHDAAVLAFNECLGAAARRLDDGTSEASIVALGLRPSCAAEFARSRNMFASSLSPGAQRMFHQRDAQAFIQAATAVVLEERAKRRQRQ